MSCGIQAEGFHLCRRSLNALWTPFPNPHPLIGAVVRFSFYDLLRCLMLLAFPLEPSYSYRILCQQAPHIDIACCSLS